MTDFYTLLGLTEDADDKDIRSAYRKLVKTCHPDLHPNNPKLKQKFIELTAAYNTLSNQELRIQYDQDNKTQSEEPLLRKARTQQDPQASYEEFLAAFKARDKSSFSLDGSWGIESLILAIIQSPITYCVLFFFLMVISLKAGIDSVVNHTTAHH